MQSRYRRKKDRERERELLWGQMVLDMWAVPHLILNLTFSPTESAQYFTLFKLDMRRCEKPILSCHNILHPQPPQPKSFTCFYANYISFLEETRVCVRVCVCVSLYTVTTKMRSPEGYRRNWSQTKYGYRKTHFTWNSHRNKISINRLKVLPDLCMWTFLVFPH